MNGQESRTETERLESEIQQGTRNGCLGCMETILTPLLAILVAGWGIGQIGQGEVALGVSAVAVGTLGLLAVLAIRRTPR